MSGFNLSEWSLRHRSFVWFLMALCVLAGVMSFQNLGREEDPSFDVKTMVVQAYWSGATVDETINQLADPIEKELSQLDEVDYTQSYTSAGKTTVMVNFLASLRGDALQDAFEKVRRHVNDIWSDMPSAALGPYFNDEFGNVYGNIYAFTADGLSFRQLRDYVDQVRRQVAQLDDSADIKVIGTQDEAIYLDFNSRKMASLGIDLNDVIDTLQEQNAVAPSGTLRTDGERLLVRTDGAFKNENDLRAVNLRVNGHFFKLTDIATISRGYVDPPDNMFRYDGQPAIALAISMRENANVLEFGKKLDSVIQSAVNQLPVGVGFHHVSDQPQIVEHAIGGFTEALFEAVAIVIVVSLISLGLRAGLIVAFSVPLTLSIVFIVMEYSGISLQRVSLGALIIALGLLVDDAMITVEMMIARLERGDSLHKAATYAFTSTAFPMLTGTIVTVAGFMPIALNRSLAGEYTQSMFIVIAVSLLVSWVVAVLFAPLIGVHVLPKKLKEKGHKKSWLARHFSNWLQHAMKHPAVTICIALVMLVLSLVAAPQIQLQFFPSSDRNDLLVDFTLPQNSSVMQTKAVMDRFEKHLKDDPAVDRWSSYVGQGAPRYFLPMDVQLSNPFFGEVVIEAKDIPSRVALQARLEKVAKEEFTGVDVYVKPLPLGVPVGRPIEYRITGPDYQEVRTLALQLGSKLQANSEIGTITYDWNEPARTLQVHIDQDRARQLGISSNDVATILNAAISGTTVTQVRDSIYLINVVARASSDERGSIDLLRDLQIPTESGDVVPLLSFADIGYGMEQPLIYRRNGVPKISVLATTVGDRQPLQIAFENQSMIKDFEKALPVGYSVETGGIVEANEDAALPLLPVVPVMLLVMAIALMVQLQSVKKLAIVVSVVPLGIIGVVVALLISGKPLGFIAILGVLALIGIIVRNSVILVDQIHTNQQLGMSPWDAVKFSTEERARPILLTAAAASLGMVPIATEVFWGPMAFAMIGGIFAATLLTLFFLPALYVLSYRIKETHEKSFDEAMENT